MTCLILNKLQSLLVERETRNQTNKRNYCNNPGLVKSRKPKAGFLLRKEAGVISRTNAHASSRLCVTPFVRYFVTDFNFVRYFVTDFNFLIFLILASEY